MDDPLAAAHALDTNSAEHIPRVTPKMLFGCATGDKGAFYTMCASTVTSMIAKDTGGADVRPVLLGIAMKNEADFDKNTFEELMDMVKECRVWAIDSSIRADGTIPAHIAAALV